MAPGRIHLNLLETFRSVFYTPIHVAVGGGFLEKEGLDVDFATCPAEFPHPLSALNHGAADIAQSGIMRSIIAADWGAETVPMHFAEINSRDGFFVLGRKPQDQFNWRSMAGATVIPVGFSPMPWASFQFALRRNGVDPGGQNLIQGLSLDDAVAAFNGGLGDYIHLPQPAAAGMLAKSEAHMAVALGRENGHIAYSSFAATNKYLDSNSDTVHRFVAGFCRALTWLEASDPAAVSRAVAPFFPSVDSEVLVRAIERYKSQGTWPNNPALEQPEYDRLQEILIAAGLVKEHQPYSNVVRPEYVEAAIKAGRK